MGSRAAAWVLYTVLLALTTLDGAEGLTFPKVSYARDKPNIVAESFELNGYYGNDKPIRVMLTHNLLFSILRPTIIVVPDWSGRPANLEVKQAIQWAERGYVGCAVDLFGRWDPSGNFTLEDLVAAPAPEKELLGPFPVANRTRMLEILTAVATQARNYDNTYIDPTKAAAVGFGIGGGLVLDMARSGVVLDGVVAFQPNLAKTDGVTKPPIIAKVLVLSSFDDPNLALSTVEAFEAEMASLSVDWQLVTYGKAGERPSLTNGEYPIEGILNRRTATATRDFFREIFNEPDITLESIPDGESKKASKIDRAPLDPVLKLIQNNRR